MIEFKSSSLVAANFARWPAPARHTPAGRVEAAMLHGCPSAPASRPIFFRLEIFFCNGSGLTVTTKCQLDVRIDQAE